MCATGEYHTFIAGYSSPAQITLAAAVSIHTVFTTSMNTLALYEDTDNKPVADRPFTSGLSMECVGLTSGTLVAVNSVSSTLTVLAGSAIIILAALANSRAVGPIGTYAVTETGLSLWPRTPLAVYSIITRTTLSFLPRELCHIT